MAATWDGASIWDAGASVWLGDIWDGVSLWDMALTRQYAGVVELEESVDTYMPVRQPVDYAC